MSETSSGSGRLTIDEGVEDGHGTVGNTSIWVNLLQDWNTTRQQELEGELMPLLQSRKAQRCEAAWTRKPTFVNVGGVGLLPSLASLLLLTRWGRSGFLAGLLLVGRSLTGWGLATSGGFLFSSFGRHFWSSG